jgi:hypothetical protein
MPRDKAMPRDRAPATSERPLRGSRRIGLIVVHETPSARTTGSTSVSHPGKPAMTIGFEPVNLLLADLGPHNSGNACFYVKRLDDIDLEVVERLIREAWKALNASDHAVHGNAQEPSGRR